MTVTDQIKILNRKIMQNESVFSSNNLDKYEYLTGEDLGLKPSIVEKAKFEYSLLGKIFNKGLDKENKKEGLLKRLENIKDTNLIQLQTIKDKSRMLKAVSEIGKK